MNWNFWKRKQPLTAQRAAVALHAVVGRRKYCNPNFLDQHASGRNAARWVEYNGRVATISEARWGREHWHEVLHTLTAEELPESEVAKRYTPNAKLCRPADSEAGAQGKESNEI